MRTLLWTKLLSNYFKHIIMQVWEDIMTNTFNNYQLPCYWKYISHHYKCMVLNESFHIAMGTSLTPILLSICRSNLFYSFICYYFYGIFIIISYHNSPYHPPTFVLFWSSLCLFSGRAWDTCREVPVIEDEQTPWKMIKLLKIISLFLVAVIVFGLALCSKVWSF